MSPPCRIRPSGVDLADAQCFDGLEDALVSRSVQVDTQVFQANGDELCDRNVREEVLRDVIEQRHTM